MNIYLAGTSVSNPENEIKIQQLFINSHKLHSYYHIFGFENNWFIMNRKNKVELFLDSGAFSAWSQGVNIDINDYIKFIKENNEVIHIYANLDVIGINGNQPNQLTAKMTYKNQRIMERAGLNPIPVFHFGEPIEFLIKYIENYQYIAIGIAGNTGKKLIPWLDDLFLNYICDKNGMPKIKIHGFAVTSLSLLLRYPWYSVDSTSWVVTGRLGSIYIPKRKNNKWIYDENSWKIAVSSRSPNKDEAGKHIDTLSNYERHVLLSYLEEKGYKLGKSEFKSKSIDYQLKDNERWAEKKDKTKLTREVEIITEPGVSNMYQLRDEINIIYFQDLENSVPKWPWKFKLRSLKGFQL